MDFLPYKVQFKKQTDKAWLVYIYGAPAELSEQWLPKSQVDMNGASKGLVATVHVPTWLAVSKSLANHAWKGSLVPLSVAAAELKKVSQQTKKPDLDQDAVIVTISTSDNQFKTDLSDLTNGFTGAPLEAPKPAKSSAIPAAHKVKPTQPPAQPIAQGRQAVPVAVHPVSPLSQSSVQEPLEGKTLVGAMLDLL